MYADVNAIGNKKFAVVWGSYNQDNSSYGVISNVIDDNGNTIGSEVIVNNYTLST